MNVYSRLSGWFRWMKKLVKREEEVKLSLDQALGCLLFNEREHNPPDLGYVKKGGCEVQIGCFRRADCVGRDDMKKKMKNK